MKIKLSRSAERDLMQLRGYIGAESTEAADDVTGRLIKAFLLLRDRPEIGRPVPDSTTREWSVPGLPYLIPYKVRADILYVVRIWHTSRDRPAAW